MIKPGSPNTLTGPAKTILEKPTFLPDVVGEARTAKGVAEASRVAGFFQGAGLLPSLGAVVSFGVGTVIGSEICNVIGIEGCWYFGSDGADPEVGTEQAYWEYTTISKWGGKPFEWAYSAGYQSFPGYTAEECAVYWVVPGGVDYAVPYFLDPQWLCGPEEEKIISTRYSMHRYSMSNRHFEYHATDDPEVGNFEHSAPEDWPDEVAAELEAGTPESDRLGEKVASEIEGSEVADPYGTKVELPDCVGVPWTTCRDTLEELELVPERVELDWETADVELDPDTVTELSPAPETEVETGTKVTVTTNPPEEGMPLVIPQPEEGETYDDYVERLAPGVEPERQTVSDANADPSAGPYAVLQTAPTPGSRLPPSGGGVDVYTNPPYVPPGGAGGGSCEASVGSVNFNPLNQPLGERFPFGVIAFFAVWVGEWSSSFSTPEFDFTVLPAGVLGAEKDIELHLDLSVVEPMMEIIRIAFLLVSFVGLLWFLATSAMKVQGDAS